MDATVLDRLQVRVRDSVVARCWDRGRALEVPTQILALGAQMVLCAAPLLVATSAVVRRAGGRGLGAPLARYLGLHGIAARDFTALFAGSSRVSMTELETGLILGVVFGTGIAATLQRGWELLWSLPRAPLRHVWRWFAWMAGLGVYKEARERLVRGLEEAHRIEKEMDAQDRQEDGRRLEKLVERMPTGENSDAQAPSA